MGNPLGFHLQSLRWMIRKRNSSAHGIRARPPPPRWAPSLPPCSAPAPLNPGLPSSPRCVFFAPLPGSMDDSIPGETSFFQHHACPTTQRATSVTRVTTTRPATRLPQGLAFLLLRKRPPRCLKPIPRQIQTPQVPAGEEGLGGEVARRGSRMGDRFASNPRLRPSTLDGKRRWKTSARSQRGICSPPDRLGRESAGREVEGGPRGLTSCSIAGSLPRGAGKHEACSIQNVFEKDGLEPFTNTPLYSLLIQRPAARSELHGQAFSPALFYKVGRAGLDAGGGGGEREKKRNRGKEGTPAGWAEGEAEAKLGSGAAAPARACGRARVTPRARATRVPRRPAAAAAVERSAPGSALARPRRGSGAVGAARAAPHPGVFVREPRSAPLRMSLCVSPGQALRAPRELRHGLGRALRLSLPGSLLSPLSASFPSFPNSLPFAASPLPLSPPGLAPPHPSWPNPRLRRPCLRLPSQSPSARLPYRGRSPRTHLLPLLSAPYTNPAPPQILALIPRHAGLQPSPSQSG